MVTNLPVNPLTGSAEGADDFGMSAAIVLERGASLRLRLATRFPSTSGTAKHLAIGAGGHKSCGENGPLRSVHLSVVRDPAPDGRNLGCGHSSSP
jgi:hypothetical protein